MLQYFENEEFKNSIQKLVDIALAEDLYYGPDITTMATIDPETIVTTVIKNRKPGVIAGIPIIPMVLSTVEKLYSPNSVTDIKVHVKDGVPVEANTEIVTITTKANIILTAERTMLNFLTHLSGIATLTHEWAKNLAEPTKVRDTRKTIPGLRLLEKYAVVQGGGMNHRMGLGDAALIKDNHIAAVGSIESTVKKMQDYLKNTQTKIEVEVDNLEQLETVLPLCPDMILLDNFDIKNIKEAVKLRDNFEQRSGVKVLLESSGGLTLDDAPKLSGIGLDFVSVGALTHSAPALDLGLDYLS